MAAYKTSRGEVCIAADDDTGEHRVKRIRSVVRCRVVAAGVEVQAATALRLEKQLSNQLDDQRNQPLGLKRV